MYIFDCLGGMSYFESILCKIKLYQLWYFGWLAFSLDWVQLDYKNAHFFPLNLEDGGIEVSNLAIAKIPIEPKCY